MKPTDPHKDFEPAVLSAAWRWIYRLRQDEVSQEELSEWLAWCDADPRHRAAFDDMQSFLQGMDRVTEGPDALSPDYWLGDLAPRNPRPPPAAAGSLRLHRRVRLALAAAAALFAAVGIFLFAPAPQEGAFGGVPPAIFTAADSSSAASLADGSHVDLAARTSLAVQIGEHQRTVTMRDGIAFFKVAKDPAKPFIVHVGKYRVRAVGTAFNIRSAGERMVVTVAEGTVDVFPESGGSGVRAHAGTEVAWAANAAAPAVAPVNPQAALEWQKNRLDYVNEPLAAVVVDLNRYSERRITLRSAAAGEIMVTGTVRTGDVQAWVEALPALFPVRLEREADGGIVIADRPG